MTRLLPRSRRGALVRSALAAIVVIAAAAGTTAVAGLLQVNSIVQIIDRTPALRHIPVTLPPAGAPETLLLVGSDHRAGQPYRDANTDTMMLVRIDDSSSTINLLSVPRDLEVTQAGVGGIPQRFKLNAMYSFGGIRLLLETLKQQVFPGLQVNHVLDVNFKAFSDMIDALGCVYTMVDHRYYNVSTGSLGGANDFSSVDIEPGYQKLCGDHQADTGALAFVRFRHTDTDIVRNARQQDFIRWTKDQYGVNQLLAQRGRLERIFGANVQTDQFLHSTDGVLELFDLIVNADKLTLKTIPFPYTFDNTAGGDYVTASTEQEAAVYRAFITPTAAPAKPSRPTPTTTTTTPATRTPAGNARGRAKPRRTRGYRLPAGLTADVGDGKSQAAQVSAVGFPVYYPRDTLAAGRYCFSITADCDSGIEPESEYAHAYPRAYEVHAGGRAYPAYVFTLEIDPVMGQYYSVEGTTWRHPPILRSPSKVITVNGKRLFVYENGGKVSLVALHTATAVYWVANSLTDSIGNAQLIGIAASLTPASA